MRRFGLPVLIFLIFVGGTAVCQWHIYETRKKPDYMSDRIYLLPNPEAMKILTAGYEDTIVDLLWIRAIQYYGQHFSSLCKPTEKGEGLIDLFKTIVALEPDFKPAYKWGAFVLTESMNDKNLCPGGARRAIKEFLEPATKQFPDDPSFAAEAGFTAFWHLHDNDLAVKMFEKAAAVPGAPANLARMIPYVRSNEDSFESLGYAFNRYQSMFLNPVNEGEKQIADSHLKRIMGRYQLLHLKRAVEAYKKKTGQKPQSLEEVAAAGVLQRYQIPEWDWAGLTADFLKSGIVSKEYENGIPVSPEGYHYVYVPRDDQVAILEEKEAQQKELIDFLNDRLAAYQKEHGECPESLEAMVPEQLKSVPPDPLGMKYSIDPVDCVIVIEVP